jgi:hypothetical protein
MLKRSLLFGMTALLALSFIFLGCKGGDAGANGSPGAPGTGGLTVGGSVATTLDGVNAYFTEGETLVYLLGTGTIGGSAAGDVASLTIAANKTLVVTSYADLNARGVTSGSVGGITVAATGSLTNSGTLKFLTGTSFAAVSGAIISAATGHPIELAADVALTEATFNVLATNNAYIAIGGGDEVALTPGNDYADLESALAFRKDHAAALALTVDTVIGTNSTVAMAQTAYDLLDDEIKAYLSDAETLLGNLDTAITGINTKAGLLTTAKTTLETEISVGSAIKTAVNNATTAKDFSSASDANIKANQAFLAATLSTLSALETSKSPQTKVAIAAIHAGLEAAVAGVEYIHGLAVGLTGPTTIPTTELALTAAIVGDFFTPVLQVQEAEAEGVEATKLSVTAEADTTNWKLTVTYTVGSATITATAANSLTLTIITPTITALTVPAITAPAAGVALEDTITIATAVPSGAAALINAEITWGTDGTAYATTGLAAGSQAYYAKVVLTASGGLKFGTIAAEPTLTITNTATTGLDGTWETSGKKVTRDSDTSITLEYKFAATLTTITNSSAVASTAINALLSLSGVTKVTLSGTTPNLTGVSIPNNVTLVIGTGTTLATGSVTFVGANSALEIPAGADLTVGNGSIWSQFSGSAGKIKVVGAGALKNGGIYGGINHSDSAHDDFTVETSGEAHRSEYDIATTTATIHGEVAFGTGAQYNYNTLAAATLPVGNIVVDSTGILTVPASGKVGIPAGKTLTVSESGQLVMAYNAVLQTVEADQVLIGAVAKLGGAGTFTSNHGDSTTTNSITFSASTATAGAITGTLTDNKGSVLTPAGVSPVITVNAAATAGVTLSNGVIDLTAGSVVVGAGGKLILAGSATQGASGGIFLENNSAKLALGKLVASGQAAASAAALATISTSSNGLDKQTVAGEITDAGDGASNKAGNAGGGATITASGTFKAVTNANKGDTSGSALGSGDDATVVAVVAAE